MLSLLFECATNLFGLMDEAHITDLMPHIEEYFQLIHHFTLMGKEPLEFAYSHGFQKIVQMFITNLAEPEKNKFPIVTKIKWASLSSS